MATSSEDFLAALGRLRDDPTTAAGEVFTPSGERMRIEKEPGPGLQMRSEVFGEDGNAASVSTLYAPALEKPAGYPSELPFVPEFAVTVTELPGSGEPPMAQWWGVAEPRIIVDRIRRESMDQGWTVEEAEQDSDAAALAGLSVSTEFVSLTRGESTRTVIASQFGAQGMVALAERRAGST